MLHAYVGIIFIFISVIILTLTTGIEIDKANNKIRVYTTILGCKKGKWEDFDKYTALTIMKLRKSQKQYCCRISVFLNIIDYYYDVALASDNFRKKIVLYSSKKEHLSMQFAQQWSKTINLPIKEYKPIPSIKTQQREAKRKNL